MMTLIEVFDFLVLLLFLYGGITQIVAPLWMNRPVFPAFRQKGAVDRKLVDASEEIDVAKDERELRRLRREAEQTRKGRIK